MTWNERAEKALTEAQKLIGAAFNSKDKPMPTFRIPAQKSDTDLVVSDYISESAERIAFLEKTLTQAVDISGVELREECCVLNDDGGSWRPAEFRVLGHTVYTCKYPELAAYLRERVGEDQK